jgi:chemotaxis methyl-accepting protein methylase
MGIDAATPVRPYTRTVQARIERGGYSEFFRVRGQSGLWPTLSSRLALPNGGNPKRIVSVGCSTGEESYSIAILTHFMGVTPPPHILGIDASVHRIAVARRGTYKKRDYAVAPDNSIPRQYLEYFSGLRDRGSAVFSVAPAIREKVEFVCGDLLCPESLPGSAREADIVLALNLIPADREASLALHLRSAELLKPGGILIVNSDSLSSAQMDILARNLRPIPAEDSIRVFENPA